MGQPLLVLGSSVWFVRCLSWLRGGCQVVDCEVVVRWLFWSPSIVMNRVDPLQARRRWQLMLKCVPDARNLGFAERLEHLVDKYVPALKQQQQQQDAEDGELEEEEEE